MYEMPIKTWDNTPSLIPDHIEAVNNGLHFDPSDQTSLLQAIDEGIIGVGPDGGINLFNSSVERLTGYSREEALGQSVFKILQLSSKKSSHLFTTTVHTILNSQDISVLPCRVRLPLSGILSISLKYSI